MSKLFFLFFLLLVFVPSQAQPPQVLCSHRYKAEHLTGFAQYPDGEDAMYKFIYKNLSWECGEKSFEGTVYLNFTVDRVGSIWDIEIQQGVAPCLDKELVRVIKLMGAWIPASINGASVCSQVTLPVRFRLGWEERNQRNIK